MKGPRQSKNRVWLAIVGLMATVLALASCGNPSPTPTSESTPTPRQAQNPTISPTHTPTVSGRDFAAYFSGKTVQIVVPFSPGGGYDIQSRAFAVVAPKHFPGNPRFIVQNRPGGAGLQGLRFAMAAEPDGFTASLLNQRFIFQEILGEDVEGFDLDSVTLIGSPSAGSGVEAVYVRRSVASSWSDVRALGRPITVGAIAPGGTTTFGPDFVELLGGPVRTVYGYAGSAEVLAAQDRGELDASAYANQQQVPRLYPEWIVSQFVVPVFYWGKEPSEDPAWLSWLEELGTPVPPHLFETVDSTQDQRDVLNEIVSIYASTSRAFVLPPGVPDDLTAAWRKAFVDTVSDPQFVEVSIAAGYDATFGDPEGMEQAIGRARALVQDEALREFAAKLFGFGR